MEEVSQIITADAEHAAFTGVTLYQDRLVVAEQNYNNQSGFWTVEGLDLPAEVVVEEVVETPADDAGATAPQTFDAGVIAAVAALISAAGYAVSKKSR